jgi:hypothetical protein
MSKWTQKYGLASIIFEQGVFKMDDTAKNCPFKGGDLVICVSGKYAVTCVGSIVKVIDTYTNSFSGILIHSPIKIHETFIGDEFDHLKIECFKKMDDEEAFLYLI